MEVWVSRTYGVLRLYRFTSDMKKDVRRPNSSSTEVQCEHKSEYDKRANECWNSETCPMER
jgi:hypothetical protein